MFNYSLESPLCDLLTKFFKKMQMFVDVKRIWTSSFKNMESSFEKIRLKKMENMKIWRKKIYEQKCGEKNFNHENSFFWGDLFGKSSSWIWELHWKVVKIDNERNIVYISNHWHLQSWIKSTQICCEWVRINMRFDWTRRSDEHKKNMPHNLK